jgi:hypothetical protein
MAAAELARLIVYNRDCANVPATPELNEKVKPCMRAPRTQISQYGQLSHSKAYFTEGALMQPIDKLTRSDFFPDIIGVEEHFAFGHLFRLFIPTGVGK